MSLAHPALTAISQRQPAGRDAPRRLTATRLCVGLLLLVAAGEETAAATCAAPVALVISAEGTVSMRDGAEGPWSAVSSGSGLCEGDVVRTGRNSRAAVRFTAANTLIRLDQATTLRILSPGREASDGHLDILEGAARFFSRVRRRLDIDTPFANALVDGTELLVRVDPEQTRVDLFEGSLLVANALGELRLSAGQGARAERGEAPRLYRLLTPEDAVQWAISYEPMLSALLWSKADARDAALLVRLREAHRRLMGGNAEAAFAELERVPPAHRGAAFHNFRAALLLSVGRVDTARADLATARRLVPGNGESDAIESGIALGLNDTKEALTLARTATESAPASPLPWLALSYAEQATFDLPAARAAMDRALAADPRNGVLRARLAELLLALGEFDAAQVAADLAVTEAPQAALTHRAQGFAALLRIDLAAARAAFRRTLDLDPADPVAHLGLGLTQIRSGHLDDGRVQLETAVSLDPLQSLLRTYLGKAYYDERREARAATAFDIAADLDPKDPTPWLYRAIQLRSQNRSVEAVDALDTSLKLNDYRAQFRTPATLEADAAARAAAVGQIYRDLDFDQLALVQGVRAVDEAPDDQSGHRLLADVYSGLPRHEEARVSELLQAQLLQPLTRTPVLPLQGETRLLTPETLGPSTLGLGEYGPLFERNGASAWVTLLGGSRNTWGDEVLATALYDRVAFSVGQYRLQTDGSGGVRPQTQDIQVGFIQMQLSPQTSVQAELRNTDTDEGPYLDEYALSTHERNRTSSARLGLTHRWSPRSVLIASLVQRRVDSDLDSSGVADPTDPSSRSFFSASGPAHGWSAELRQDWRFDQLVLTAGTSWLDTRTEGDLDLTLTTSQEGDLIRSTQHSNLRVDNNFASVWIYGTLRPAPWLDLTLGLSWDSLQWNERRIQATTLELLIPEIGWLPFDDGGGPATIRSSSPIERLNPNLGLMWRPFPGTLLRVAAFRTLRGPDEMRQTIAPVQVAGFNRLFDGSIGETAWRYGIGIDQRVSDRIHIGVEGSRREVEEPGLEISDNDSVDRRSERFLRAYAAVALSPRVALSAEHFYEENVLRQLIGAEDRTHRTPLTLTYFGPSGLLGSICGTYVQQSVNPSGSTSPERESFWNLELSLGFRLPGRRGMVVATVDNLLGRDFSYRETDANQPLFLGERVFSLHATLPF